MCKNIFALLLIVFSLSLSVTPIFAEDVSKPGDIRNEKLRIKNTITNLRNEKKDMVKEIKQNIQQKISLAFARLTNAVVTGINGAVITVTHEGKTYSINTDQSTMFKRHFWGKSSLSEISTNDKLNIWGKYTDDAKTTINARIIRDVSITKRFGVFVGTVADLSGSNFTLNAVARGAQKVTFNGSTKCVNRKEQVINCSDVQTGHRVRVKGMWDETNKTITEVTHIKDYSLPVIITPTITPIPTI